MRNCKHIVMQGSSTGAYRYADGVVEACYSLAVIYRFHASYSSEQHGQVSKPFSPSQDSGGDRGRPTEIDSSTSESMLDAHGVHRHAG